MASGSSFPQNHVKFHQRHEFEKYVKPIKSYSDNRHRMVHMARSIWVLTSATNMALLTPRGQGSESSTFVQTDPTPYWSVGYF